MLEFGLIQKLTCQLLFYTITLSLKATWPQNILNSGASCTIDLCVMLFALTLCSAVGALLQKDESCRRRPNYRLESPSHLASQELSLDLFSHLGTTANVLQLEQQLVGLSVINPPGNVFVS